MDANARKQAIRKIAEKKFGGKTKVVCKRRPQYPLVAEMEYKRVANGYMRLLSKVLAEEIIPEIRRAANEELSPGYWRQDDTASLTQRLAIAFDKCSEHLDQQIKSFNLHNRLTKIAALTVKLSIKDWKKAVKETVGIDLMDDYYTGEFYRQILSIWTENNVSLIKTIPKNTLGKMEEIVMDGYLNGRTTTNIVKDIQRTYSVSRKRARFIARDQIAKLNCEITKKQQEDAGIEEYEWSDSRDERVRDRHHELDGKRFRWDDPPIVDERTGRRAHPGQDYLCRCCSLAVFDLDTMDL